jgi:hypothetical protein
MIVLRLHVASTTWQTSPSIHTVYLKILEKYPNQSQQRPLGRRHQHLKRGIIPLGCLARNVSFVDVLIELVVAVTDIA